MLINLPDIESGSEGFDDRTPPSTWDGILAILANNAEPIKLAVYVTPFALLAWYIWGLDQVAEDQRIAAIGAARKGSLALSILAKREAASEDGRTTILLALEALPRPFDAASPLFVPQVLPLLRWGLHLPLEQRRLLHERAVNSAAFSPDGTRIVTASWDETARVWDAASGEPLLTLKGQGGTVNSATFSPDGTRIVTASGGPQDPLTGSFQKLLVTDEPLVYRVLSG